jgi:hypothetical protein
MRRAAESLRLLERAFADGPLRRTHLPALVPASVLAALRPFLAEDVRGVEVSAHRSGRTVGRFPTAGLCLEGLPLPARRPLSWRELPLGLWSSGPAVPPVPNGTDLEEQVCVNGLLVEDDEDPDGSPDLPALVADALGRLGMPDTPERGAWGLPEPAWIWRADGRVTASAQRIPEAAAEAAGIRFMDRSGRQRPASVSFFHIGQYALLRGERLEQA